MQHPFSRLYCPAVADRNASHDATVRSLAQRSRRGQLIGTGARELVVEMKKVASLGSWIPKSASQDVADGMKLVLERGDNTEVTTATSNSPKEVLVLLVAGRQQPPVSSHHIGREQVVTGKTMFAVEPAEATSEGETCDTGH